MYCVVQDCRSVWKHNSTTKFHSFPEDVNGRNAWLSNIQLKETENLVTVRDFSYWIADATSNGYAKCVCDTLKESEEEQFVIACVLAETKKMLKNLKKGNIKLSNPKAVFYTCMDSRMIPTRFTETSVGDMFVVRNAGNVIPHSQYFADEMTSCEPAALELGCIINNIRHIIVCGHSDCKAMNLLYTLKSDQESSTEQRRISPLKSWLCNHGNSSLKKFLEMDGDFAKPMVFTAETPQRKFVAYIDPDNKFCIEDKLSQVNTLQQLQNVASYGMLKKRLEKHDLHIHALWFDIYTGDIYYFSRRAKRFIIIDESSYESILSEVRRYYS